ncbi:hypothetical protein DSECCO2_604500 [anaerobic digester metagenome]
MNCFNSFVEIPEVLRDPGVSPYVQREHLGDQFCISRKHVYLIENIMPCNIAHEVNFFICLFQCFLVSVYLRDIMDHYQFTFWLIPCHKGADTDSKKLNFRTAFK